MDWLQRYARLQKKLRRLTIKRNVRAYRQRQSKAGIRRLDVSLNSEQYARLLKLVQPGETYSAAIGRVIDAVTGNR